MCGSGYLVPDNSVLGDEIVSTLLAVLPGNSSTKFAI